MLDSCISTLNQKYTYYKIYSTKKNLLNICFYEKYDRKTFDTHFGYYVFYRDNRLL